MIYPIKFLCYENLQWAIPLNQVDQMNHWYQLWSKAGANPNFRVENPDEYIKNFNWLGNWFQAYFFNKVSDFILGIMFLALIFVSAFFRKKIKTDKRNFLFIYIILLILFFEWFYFHPALRYGGYHLFALLFFIPISISLQKTSQSYSVYLTKAKILIAISIIIFVGRNISRLNNEYNKYNYNPFFDYRYEINDNYNEFRNLSIKYGKKYKEQFNKKTIAKNILEIYKKKIN